MTDDPDFDASNVRVEVSGGEVRLSGHVADDEARCAPSGWPNAPPASCGCGTNSRWTLARACDSALRRG